MTSPADCITEALTDMKIVLASGSPRRRELLNAVGVTDFEVCPAKGEEKAADNLPPQEIVKCLSCAKAQEVAANYGEDTVIIAADTIVWADGRVFGKPKNEDDAFAMLRTLSGKSHEVYTGISVICNGRTISEAECTSVRFRNLSDDEIRAYIATGEPMDKAGAYGIQGRASLMVEKIDGDYFNVVGLPLCRLGQMLKTIGVHLL